MYLAGSIYIVGVWRLWPKCKTASIIWPIAALVCIIEMAEKDLLGQELGDSEGGK